MVLPSRCAFIELTVLLLYITDTYSTQYVRFGDVISSSDYTAV